MFPCHSSHPLSHMVCTSHTVTHHSDRAHIAHIPHTHIYTLTTTQHTLKHYTFTHTHTHKPSWAHCHTHVTFSLSKAVPGLEPNEWQSPGVGQLWRTGKSPLSRVGWRPTGTKTSGGHSLTRILRPALCHLGPVCGWRKSEPQ